MAVVNYFPYSGQAEDLTGVPEDWALQQGGIEEKFFQRDIAIAAGDSNGSSYCIMQGIPADAILTQLAIEVDAAGGFTSCDIGLYDSDTGAVVADNCYANALNVAAGSTKLSPFDGLAALTHAQTTQRVRDLVATATGLAAGVLKARYDLVMTMDAAAGAGITFSVRGRLVSSV